MTDYAHTSSSSPSRSRAGTAALAAAVTLLLSGIALALFFGGFGYIFGPVNDVLLGLTFVLLVPAILEVRLLSSSTVGSWFSWLSYAAIAGIVVLVIGQVALVTRMISLQTSFVTLSVGVLPFLVWATALAVLSLQGRLLGPALGRWGIAFALALVSAAVGWYVLPMAVWSVLGAALLVTFLGWIVTLGRQLG